MELEARRMQLIHRWKMYLSAVVVLAFSFFSIDGHCRAQEIAAVPTLESDPLLANESWIDEIHAKMLWNTWQDNGMIPGEEIVVAVLDSGLDVSHEDLKNAVWTNEAELGGEDGVDDDQNGYIDDIHGVNLVNSFTRMTDSYGHGTQMSGIIGMTANDGGGVGAAYGCKIMPIKCSVNGGFSISTVVEGLEYAVQQGADVINMSFGTYIDDPELREAVKKASKHCVIVAAAGNEGTVIPGVASSGSESEDTSREGIVYPAAYEEVIGVMSCEGDALASYSNWDSCPNDGIDYDIAAPGSAVYTTNRNGNYTPTTGTSGATAMVSASVAIFMDLYKAGTSLSYEAVKEKFLETMKHQMIIRDEKQEITFPRLDLSDIVEKALHDSQIKDLDPPVLKNNTLESAIAGDSIVVSASATDNIGVKKVVCCYCLPDGTWKEIDMEKQEGETYRTTVQNAGAGDFKYYLIAYDEMNQAFCGSEQNPLSMKIYKADISKLQIASAFSTEYTGQAVTPAVEIWDGDVQLTENIDYTLAYENNMEEGTAFVNIFGKGDYTGKTFTYFYIVKKKQNETEGANDTTQPGSNQDNGQNAGLVTEQPVTPTSQPSQSGSTSKKTVCHVPAIAKITKFFINSKGKLVLKWTKKTGKVSGYQIVVRNKKSKKSQKYLAHQKKKLLPKKFKSNKKYRIRVRAYRTIHKKTYYGKWKTIKAKVK